MEHIKDQIEIQTAKLAKAETVQQYYDIMQRIGQLQLKFQAETQKIKKDVLMPNIINNMPINKIYTK